MRRVLQAILTFTWLAVGGASAAARAAGGSETDTPGNDRSGVAADDGKPRRTRKWRRRLLKAAALLTVLGVLGFLAAASGIMPIKASSGHWAITEWFLHFSMQRSISTHSLGTKVPELDDPALVLKGAGHYEFGCRPCHGSPRLHQPRVALAMTPHPPYLPPRIPNWDPEELFYLVKHGVKFTGMPAWPTQQRDDEVWAMTAFLLKYQDMAAEEYHRLAFGEVEPDDATAPLEGLTGPTDVPHPVLDNCGRCHGRDGLGRGEGAFPKLAGQTAAYMEASLLTYADGERHSGIMEPLAAGLDREQIREVARYYAERDPPKRSAGDEEDAEAIARGEAIARRGIPTQRVPACHDCHAPDDAPRNPIFPILSGQYADYLALQLELFKKGARGGTDYAHIMNSVASRLSAEQMRDVAAYFAAHESGDRAPGE